MPAAALGVPPCGGQNRRGGGRRARVSPAGEALRIQGREPATHLRAHQPSIFGSTRAPGLFEPLWKSQARTVGARWDPR